MAEVLGSAGVDPGAVDPGSGAIWLVADPGHEKFNTEVPVAVLGASSSFLYREQRSPHFPTRTPPSVCGLGAPTFSQSASIIIRPNSKFQ